MNDLPSRWRVYWFLPLLGLVLGGYLFARWSYDKADRDLREEFLTQARLVAQALNVEHVAELSGQPEDLDKPAYIRLMEQLASVRSAGGHRYVYLMGARPPKEAGEALEIIFLLDVQNDVAEADPASQPGDPYDDASDELISLFGGEPALVEGPYPDEWGVWISALVPIHDPVDGSVLAVMGMDIDASDWAWNVTGRAALPTGLMALLLLAGLFAVLGTRRIAPTPHPVMRRLLPPLAIVMILLIAGAGALMLWMQQRHIVQVSEANQVEVLADFRDALALHTESLASITAWLAKDERVIHALRDGSVDLLNQAWDPLFTQLREQSNVTHMHVMNIKRACVLQGHCADQTGDVIDRYTARTAEAQGTLVSGLEIGPHGAFTLIVVNPVLVDGRIIGYIEAGKTVSEVFEHLHARHNRQLALLLRKNILDRAAWEVGEREAGRQVHWERLEDSVITYVSRPGLEDILVTGLTGKTTGGMQEDWLRLGLADRQGRNWRLSEAPIHDAASVEVGRLVILMDMTMVDADFRNALFIGGVVAVVSLIGLLGLTFVLLYRTDAGIRTQQGQVLKLTRAVEQSPAVVVITDIEGRIEYVNPAFSKVTGYTREEAIGQNPKILQSGEQDASLYKQLWETILSGQQWQGEFLNKRKDGSLFWETATISPVRDGGEAITHFLAVKEDITDRKANDERMRAFAQCLLEFGADPQANINRLVALCGGQLGGVCALYNRLEADMLCSIGQWQTPPGYHPVDRATGHLCHDVILGGSDEPFVVRDLQRSSYLKSDPNVAAYGLQSYIGMAVKTRGKAVGSLCVVFQQDVEPNKDQLNFLRLAGFAAAVEEERLMQLRMQTLLTEIASTYIHLPLDRVDTAIEKSLGDLGTFVMADRAYVFDYNFGEGTCTNTHEWCAEGVEPQINELQAVPLDMITWWVTVHRRGETMYIPRVLELAKDSGLRKVLEPQGIKSLIAVPMMDGENCLGFVGFDSVCQPHAYSKQEQHLLSVFAQMLISVRKRRQMEEDLRDSRIRAEDANRAKSEFLANLSHEIRTPMNGVIGMTSILLNTPLSTEQKRFAETAMSSAESLLTLLNDVLDFSKMEADKLVLDRTEFSVRRTMDEAVAPLALRAQQKGVEFVCAADPDVPEMLRGDPVRLRQILVNLAGNAVKFTDRGEVVLRVERIKSEGASTDATPDHLVMLRFSVRDTGIGIPDDKTGLLFQKFSQVDASTTRRYGGTGLGLAIARELTELMGGEIGVDSTFGKGATFWFTARFEATTGEVHEPINSEYAVAESIREAKILIIDDNETNRQVLRTHLESWGVKTYEAVSGPDAMLVLRRAREEGTLFNAAILDMQMPGMDGIALAEVIRSEPTYHATRLILLTSIGHTDDTGRLKAAGFSAWLTKPVRASELFNVVQEVLLGTATVTVDVPDTPVYSSTTVAAKGLSAIRKFNVLLVEDNAVNRAVAEQYLRNAGVKVITAANGAEAMNRLTERAFDLILMDVQMPVMDGYETTRKIRASHASPHYSKIPIIAMTAHAMVGDREKCLEAGMNDYVSKPIRPAELQAMLIKWLLPGET